jgi:hypothetical protein
MTRKNPKNTAASVRQRLLNLSRQSGEDFQLLLTRYGPSRSRWTRNVGKPPCLFSVG